MWGFGCSVLFVRRFARLYLILRTDYEGLVDLFVLDVALEEVAEVSIEHRSLVVVLLCTWRFRTSTTTRP